jgi:hypothetical protein
MSRTSLTIGKGTHIYVMAVFAAVVIVEQDLLSRCLLRVCLVKLCM